MKNQYFGDVGDYGKYGLLRFLSVQGVSIAVNWYLTPGDKTNDGNKRDYLNDDGFRACDPGLYDVLKDMCTHKAFDVHTFAARDMIPGAICFEGTVEPHPDAKGLSVPEKRALRKRWHKEALAACDGPQLVFLDPDNGLRPGCPSARKDTPKYAYASEVREYYDRGQDVVYYCHKGRRTQDQWEKARRAMLEECLDAALMGLTYHRGTQRSYLFLVHSERESFYRALLKDFLNSPWKTHFTDEFMVNDQPTGARSTPL